MATNVILVSVTSDTFQHLEMIMNAGVMIGPRGRREVNPSIRPLVDALYHVLAGGTVKGSVPGTLTVTGGAIAQVQEYQMMERRCNDAMNEVNAGQPYNLVAEV